MGFFQSLGVAAQQLLGMVMPFLKLFGHTSIDLTSGAVQGELKSRLWSTQTLVVSRLEHDGMTPALKGDGEAAERQVIRSAMYLSLKEGLKGLGVSRGANVLADQIRDMHDDNVVVMVSPKIDHTTSTADMVKFTVEALIERMF